MNYHRERFRKLTFRALALRQSEKQKKGSKRNNLGKGEFPPAVPPDGQYVVVTAESD